MSLSASVVSFGISHFTFLITFAFRVSHFAFHISGLVYRLLTSRSRRPLGAIGSRTAGKECALIRIQLLVDLSK